VDNGQLGGGNFGSYGSTAVGALSTPNRLKVQPAVRRETNLNLGLKRTAFSCEQRRKRKRKYPASLGGTYTQEQGVENKEKERKAYA
jgi:hypothetical protein